MLSFEFSQDHEVFRETLKRFVRERVGPALRAKGNPEEFPWEQYRELAALGVLGMGLPAEYGGTGEQDFIGLGIAAEELGRASVSLASTVSTVGVMGGLIASAGTPEVRARYLPGFIGGKEIISLGLTEPESGSDAAGLRSVAEKVPGGWLLTGHKNAVSHLGKSVATIVFARRPGTERGSGVSAFIVELDRPGIHKRQYNDMGLRDFARGALALDRVFVPEANLMGDEGKGFGLVLGAFDFARATVSLFCLGAARASLDEACDYLKVRETFGRPLTVRQGLTIPLAEHFTQIEACRWLCYRTLWLRDRNEAHTADASMAKWWGVDIARDAIETALLIHGHGGWSSELPFERRFRDVMGFKLGDGSPEIHKLIIAREFIGREVFG